MKKLRNGKAPGPGNIPEEALKVDLDTSTKILFILFEKIFEEDKLPDDWKESLMTKLPKKEDLRVPGKVIKRIISGDIKTAVHSKLTRQVYRQDRSCTGHIATQCIIIKQSLE